MANGLLRYGIDYNLNIGMRSSEQREAGGKQRRMNCKTRSEKKKYEEKRKIHPPQRLFVK